MKRFLQFALVAMLAPALSACDLAKMGDGPSDPTPIPANVVNYIALGASDTWGIGSSVPCEGFQSCAGATGYTFLVERRLRQDGKEVRFTTVGFPGVVLSPTIQQIGNQLSFGILGNVLDGQMRFVQPDATLVTIFIGGNDVNVISRAVRNGLGGTQSTAYIQGQVTQFGTDYRALVDGIKTQAPQARIVVINLPNMAALPTNRNLSLAEKRVMQSIAVGFTAQINGLTTLGARVVDIMCDPVMYQNNMFSSDGFHPNDAGYARMAELVYTSATGSPSLPKASCAEMAQY